MEVMTTGCPSRPKSLVSLSPNVASVVIMKAVVPLTFKYFGALRKVSPNSYDSLGGILSTLHL